ncbi:uncharacterized protein N7484_001650 [Penicillium longicatenatum]|uniref:uncharacterized protein n=1 Tax=Penicillium longicatenatum TaxID=1561947 RepID=UPI00254719EB|nr:uncharacterized protein N7484_001650 [Penicillium longicatenatum]KAJ5658001.1 hypothetical protein N7484_001650 [Penicillium longicatenatum]
MKATIISTLLLAASTTLAAPSNLKRALQPLQIKNLVGNLYTETPPTSNNIVFALNDPNTNVDTDCDAVWSIGQAGNLMFPCSNSAYQVNFPNGIYNIEDFVLRVSRTDGTEAGQNTVSGADWVCTTNDGYPEESCQWVGVFNVDVTASS